MKKLYKLILRTYAGPLLGTFFIAVFVLLMQFLWKYVDDLVGKGLEWYIITELLFYASATFVPMALPLAVLLSSLMSFGNLGERYELVAMKAAGISLQKVMYPLIVLIVFISIAAFFFSNNVMPVANLKFRSILYDVKEQKLAFNIKENIYYSGIDGYVIRVAKKGKDGNSLKKVMIYDHTGNEGNTKVTIADSGYMQLSNDQQNMYLKLFDGYNFEEETTDVRKRRKDPLQRTYFDEQIVKFDLSGFDLKRTDENLFRNNYHMLNLQQLSKAQDSLSEKLSSAKSRVDQRIRREGMYHYNKYGDRESEENDTISAVDTIVASDTVGAADTLSVNFLEQLKVSDQVAIVGLALSSARRSKNQVEFNGKSIERQERLIRKHEVEWHRKFTLSFACLVLFFIGAPLGAIIRKGGLGLPLVISIFFFVTYHIISITGEKYAEAGVMSVFGGMWLASAILLPLGIFLTAKATTDAPLLDVEVWKKLLNKWIGRLRSGK